MRLLIAAVGRLKQGPERELFAHYLARGEALGRKLGLTPIAAIEIAESKDKTAPKRKAAEAAALLQPAVGVADPQAQQAVAAAQVIVEEGERCPDGEGVQPQGDLGELDRNRVLVDPGHTFSNRCSRSHELITCW